MIAFGFFVWFTKHFVWTPIIAALEERKGKIADGLAAAERGQHEQELAKHRSADVLRDAKSQAAEIINQAQKRAGEIVDTAKETARLEGERLLESAKSDIEQEANRTREGLRQKVSELAVLGAEKILHREVNADTHRDVLDAVAKQL
jgi:F-type H+-transporting ATPase subunit b